MSDYVINQVEKDFQNRLAEFLTAVDELNDAREADKIKPDAGIIWWRADKAARAAVNYQIARTAQSVFVNRHIENFLTAVGQGE